jgi:hypothetical protein
MTLSFGNFKSAYWQDSGSTNSVRSIVLDQNTTVIAVYEER